MSAMNGKTSTDDKDALGMLGSYLSKKDMRDPLAGAEEVINDEEVPEEKVSAKEFAGDLGETEEDDSEQADEESADDDDSESDESVDSDGEDADSDDEETDSGEETEDDDSDEDAEYVEFRYGDEVVKVRADATVTMPVNGKDTEITYADMQRAVNLYELNKRQKSEFDKEHQKFQLEKTDFNDGLKAMNEALELVGKGDPFGALIAMISIAKDETSDPGLLLRNYLFQAKKTVNTMQKYTAEQLEQTIAKRSSEWKEKRLKDREDRLTRTQKEIEFKETFSARLTEAGVTQEQYKETEAELLELQEKGGIDADLNSMQPEHRANYILRQALDVDIPFKRFVTLASSKYTEQQLDTMLKDDELVATMVAVAKAGNDNTVLATLKSLFREQPKKAEVKPGSKGNQSSGTKKVTRKKTSPEANGAASSKRALLTFDDLLADIGE